MNLECDSKTYARTAGKAKACKTPEELIALAKQEGYELGDEELKEISGGVSWDCISDCHDHAPCPSDR